MLESNDLLVLKRAFAFADHEFTRGFVYLTEDAITDRIEEVDPAWTFDILNIVHEGNNAICHARLTIKNVARDGVGMQQILEKAGEPAKGAATDALKRCARLFGIGRYLLNAPKENEGFGKWLADQQKANAAAAPSPAPQLPPPPVDAPLAVVPKAEPSSSATSPASAGASGNTLTTVTVGADVSDAIDEAFGKREANTITVSQVRVGKTDKGGRVLTFEQGGVKVLSFTREPLRDVLAGDVLEQLAVVGVYEIPSVRLMYSLDGKFLKLDKAELVA